MAEGRAGRQGSRGASGQRTPPSPGIPGGCGSQDLVPVDRPGQTVRNVDVEEVASDPDRSVDAARDFCFRERELRQRRDVDDLD